MSSQGRTAKIAGPYEIGGQLFFFKRNPTKEITDIEERIYAALAADPVLQEHGMYVPYVERVTEDTLAIEDMGPSLGYRLHFMSEEEGTPNLLAQLFGSRETTFTELLETTITTNGRINDIITATLTEDDKNFLQAQQQETVFQAAKKINDSEDITRDDIQKHFWAYQVMNALRFYDRAFKDAYTHLIGKKIDALLPTYGSWLGDACVRNVVSPDGETIVPIDFNSIHYGPKQMDDAAIIGLYIFSGPLGTHATDEKRRVLIERMRKQEFSESDPQEYFAAFMLSCFHRNVILAGYRTKEAEEKLKEAKEAVNTGRGLRLDIFRECRMAFNEIEYQHTAAVESARAYAPLFAQTPEEQEAMRMIQGEVDTRTFGRRMYLIMDPFFQQANSMLSFLYYGPDSGRNSHLNQPHQLT